MTTAENIDCMEGMRHAPDGFWDLAIVDPPYGIDVANMNMGLGKSKNASKTRNRKWVAGNWDKDVPGAAYFTELFRVSKNQIIWGGNYFGLPAFKNYIVWDKEIPEGLSFADVEMAWTSFSMAPKIFRYSAYLDKKSKFHPTQKPVALYRWLLQNYAKPGDKILDTHLGSGSSRIAAHDMGLDFTGFELDPDYFRDQEARFAAHIKKPTLFAPAEMYTFEQQKLF